MGTRFFAEYAAYNILGRLLNTKWIHHIISHIVCVLVAICRMYSGFAELEIKKFRVFELINSEFTFLSLLKHSNRS